ncbi:putative glutamate receptor [Tachypleus tridentatus]|uniref:putative glutamate receptor n=1 Tax=Tachypleus tridentatus TaxID=6853 RepID=UPI003FD4491E
MDIVTEGDQLVLITEESQNRSNCGSFLIESLIWKNDGSATFTNAQDRKIIFPPSQKNFGGRTFRATLLKKNNDRLAIKVLDVLSQVLNFSLTFPDPPADSYGTRDEAGEWGGAVGELARKERDVAAIQLSWTSERNAVIDFVEFYQLAALMFSTRTPRQFPRSGALFRLFGVEVWIAYFFASLLSGGIVAATWIFYSFTINPKDGATSPFSILKLSLEATLKISLWQGVEKLPKNIGSRIVFTIWAVACLIVLSVYCGNIRAFLSIKETEKPLDTVDDVLENNVPAYYYPGTSTESFLRETSFSLVHELWKKNKHNNKERMNPNQYLDLMTNGGILLATNVNLEKIFQQHNGSSRMSCPFRLAKQRLKEDYLCLGLQKNSPFLEPMSYRIRDFKRGGIIQFWQKRIIEEQVIKEGSCDPRLRSNKDQTNYLLSLSLNDVVVSFKLLLSGYVMSTVIFCAEYLIVTPDCIYYYVGWLTKTQSSYLDHLKESLKSEVYHHNHDPSLPPYFPVYRSINISGDSMLKYLDEQLTFINGHLILLKSVTGAKINDAIDMTSSLPESV